MFPLTSMDRELRENQNTTAPVHDAKKICVLKRQGLSAWAAFLGAHAPPVASWVWRPHRNIFKRLEPRSPPEHGRTSSKRSGPRSQHARVRAPQSKAVRGTSVILNSSARTSPQSTRANALR